MGLEGWVEMAILLRQARWGLTNVVLMGVAKCHVFATLGEIYRENYWLWEFKIWDERKSQETEGGVWDGLRGGLREWGGAGRGFFGCLIGVPGFFILVRTMEGMVGSR